MKYLKEYRDPEAVQKLARYIQQICTRPWKLMEICGGQTHAILRFGLDQLLPANIELLHGPGCPVCVTPRELIDAAIELSLQPGCTLCSFGDMLRVPGSSQDLLAARAQGGSLQTVYSPLDAVRFAETHPERQIVFFAVGFETTVPATALAVYTAKRKGLKNFSLLVSHVLVPPAISSILASGDNQVQAFLAAGHVCAVMGTEEYRELVSRYRIPIVVTGFEPIDILQGIALCVEQLEQGRFELMNQYSRAVRELGNQRALDLVQKVFTISDRKWRGIGTIKQSGLDLSPEYEEFDAHRRFLFNDSSAELSTDCISGQILRGVKKPPDCAAFGCSCTPDHPLGATMVSSEGACAAYYRYRLTRTEGGLAV